MPELLVLHQALLLSQVFAFSPFIYHLLLMFLEEENNMAQAETSSFLQLYVYFTLVDPALPFSPTFVAAGYPLCKPLVNPLQLCTIAKLGGVI